MDWHAKRITALHDALSHKTNRVCVLCKGVCLLRCTTGDGMQGPGRQLAACRLPKKHHGMCRDREGPPFLGPWHSPATPFSPFPIQALARPAQFPSLLLTCSQNHVAGLHVFLMPSGADAESGKFCCPSFVATRLRSQLPLPIDAGASLTRAATTRGKLLEGRHRFPSLFARHKDRPCTSVCAVELPTHLLVVGGFPQPPQ
jgi:hypothetical protein